MADAVCIAIVGAECTGKTTLAHGLAHRLAAGTGARTAWVAETLREWCDIHGRTPRRDEQAAIAAEHGARIDAAAAANDIVVCDTTALMTTVYSRHLFGDDTLDATAVAAHRRCALTLLTAIDLPWQSDGLQRDGAHVREPVDRLLRTLMDTQGIAYAVVSGRGAGRLDAALAAIAPLWRATPATPDSARAAGRGADTRWRSRCTGCDDPACELRLRPARG